MAVVGNCGLAETGRWKQFGSVPAGARCPRGRGLSTTPNDCLRCGVCCHSNLDTYVRVTGADWERLGADAERVAHFAGNRAYLRMTGGHCAALDVRATADGGREFFCTIYERRPQVCRDLARGSPECEGELAVKTARVAATTTTG
jgi:uncharacterized protein